MSFNLDGLNFGSGGSSSKRTGGGSDKPSPFSFGGPAGGAAATAASPVSFKLPPAAAPAPYPRQGGGSGSGSSFSVGSPGVAKPPSGGFSFSKPSSGSSPAPAPVSSVAVTAGATLGSGEMALVPIDPFSPSPSPLHPTAHDSETSFPPEAFGRLSCLGPDGRSVHSVAAGYAGSASIGSPNAGTGAVGGNGYDIVTNFLPLADKANGELDERGGEEVTSAYSYSEPSVAATAASRPGRKRRQVDAVRTSLSDGLAECLAIDPPIGLICVDNDSAAHDAGSGGGVEGFDSGAQVVGSDCAPAFKALPLLCLYTARSAYLLRITYSTSGNSGTAVGAIRSYSEPFEQHLLAAPSSTRILTVLPAPGCGYQPSSGVLCRPGTLAALLSGDGEDSVVVFHGDSEGGGLVSVPLVRGYEDLGQDESDPLVDFCFLSPSPAVATGTLSDDDDDEIDLSLFPSMAALLLSKSGCVYVASPILFDGALYPRRAVFDASRYLTEEANRLNEITNDPAQSDVATVLSKRVKGAKKFIEHAFGVLVGNWRKTYVMSKLSPNDKMSATAWAASAQGPVLTMPEANDSPSSFRSACIVSLPGTGAGSSLICGFAVGRFACISGAIVKQPRVDIGIVSAGLTVAPRFSFEMEDAGRLDAMVAGAGMIAEVVQFESATREKDGESANLMSSDCCTMIADPVDGSTVHHVTSQGVVTITTTAIDVVGRKVCDSLPDVGEIIQTSAWSCLEVAAFAALEGVVVSGDAHLGHVLVARSSDGSTEAINLTAAQYLHEASKTTNSTILSERTPPLPSSQTGPDEALEAVEAILPMHELMAPLVEEISSGLGSMSKIVGGATRPCDANPGTVATVLETKSMCEREIVLPMKELNQVTTARMKILQEMYTSQLSQIEQLQNLVGILRERIHNTAEKKKVAEANATTLSHRCAAVLSAARDLVPTITEAEHEYFMQLKRYEASCTKWQAGIEKMKEQSDNVCDSDVTCSIEMKPDQLLLCEQLLQGQGDRLKETSKRFAAMTTSTKKMLKTTGLEAESAELNGQKENNSSKDNCDKAA